MFAGFFQKMTFGVCLALGVGGVGHASQLALSAEELAAQAMLAIDEAASAQDEILPALPGREIRPKARRASYPSVQKARIADTRPRARPYILPVTRWEHRPDSKRWTRAGMEAVLSHGAALVRTVPSDYRTWCPAYAENSERERAMFWVAFMSALAKHESTYRQEAVGGGGLWYGLLQILPDTARRYGCKARTGEALKDGALNLSCAARIMAVTVPRDGVIHGVFSGTGRKYRGITADWGPMHSQAKRSDMARWTRQQPYCISTRTLRPQPRPEGFSALALTDQ